MPGPSLKQRVLFDGTGKARTLDVTRIREGFLNTATAYFRATTDEDRERIRERVAIAAIGLEAPEILALAEAARRRARGAREASPLTTITNLED